MKILDAISKARRRQRHGSFLPAAIGAGVGTAAGLTTGLLIAPRPGKETREQLGKSAKEAATRVKGTVLEARDKVEETAGLVKSRFGGDEKVAEMADMGVKKPAKL